MATPWIQQLFQGLGGQQQPQDLSNPYAIDFAMQQAQNQAQRGQAMQQMPVGAGRMSFIAGLANLLGGRALEARAGESMKEALNRRFQMDAEAKQAAEAKAEAETKKKRSGELWDKIRLENAKQKAIAANRAPQGPDVRTIGNQLVQVGPDGKARVLFTGQREQQQPGFDERLISSLPPELQQQAILSRLGIAPKEKTLDAQDIKLIQAEDQRRVSLDNASDLVGRLTKMTEQGVGGPIASTFVPRVTGAGQQIESYDAMAAQLADEITRLTRIPGVGAQSDAELRAALAAIPTSDKNEATRMQMLEQIAKKIERLKNSPTFFEISRGQHGERPQPAQQQPGMTGDPLIDKYLGGG